ncbi:MAG: flagellar hook-length control protein FliK [Thermodesulfobacteriota bacterium]
MIQQSFLFNMMSGSGAFPVSNILKVPGGAGQILPSKSGLAANRAGFAGVLARVCSRGHADNDMGLEAGNGLGVVDTFRQLLLAKGGNLEELQVDEKGLSAFKKILVGAGYNPEKVAELYSGWRTGVGGSGITAAELFAKVNQLDERDAGGDKTLDMALLPFLQVILSKFGVDQEQIDTTISESTIAGEGISLQRLVGKLRSIAKPADAVKPGNPAREPGEVEKLMTAMELECGAEGGDGAIDLNTFIAALERKLRSGVGKEKADMTLAEAAERLFGGITNGAASMESTSEETIRKILPNRMIDNEKKALGAHKAAEVKSAHMQTIEPGRTASLADQGKEFRKLAAEQMLSGDNIQNELSGDELADMQKIGRMISAEFGEDMGKQKEDRHAGDMASYGEGLKQSGRTGAAFSATAPGSTAKTLPVYVLNQVSRQIVRSVRESDNEIHLQLKPPQLGRLHISLESGQDGLRVSIVTEQQTTREILVSHLEEMRTVLLEQGIRLEKIDVQITFNFDQHMAQTREDARQSADRKNSGFQMPGDEAKSGAAVEELAALRPRQPSGLLDLVV